jgi:hypothetical protein
MTPAVTEASHAPKKRGPNTPEGKARSAMNALKHGLRARSFGILPEESPAEWTEHVSDLRAGYGPVDAAEEKLVTAIAVAMWKEIRADRAEAEVMAEIPPCRPDRSHGTDLQEPRHAMSLGTAIRYMTAAGMATQRAQRAFLAHRKAKRAGLIVPEPAEAAVPAANQNCTNEFGADRAPAPAPPQQSASDSQKCTNEFPHPGLPKPDPLAALRTRLERLLDGPGPREPEEWDLIAAIRAVKLPGAPRPTAAGSTGSSWRRPWTASASMSPASPGSCLSSPPAPRPSKHDGRRPADPLDWARQD